MPAISMMRRITLTRRWRPIPTIRQHGSPTLNWRRKNPTGSEPSRVLTRLRNIPQQLLSQAVGQWPAQLQPPTRFSGFGPSGEILRLVCARRSSCDLGLVRKALCRTVPSVLYREQRWEQITKLPAPQASQTEAWFQRGVAFAQLDDCQTGDPVSGARSLEIGSGSVWNVPALVVLLAGGGPHGGQGATVRK